MGQNPSQERGQAWLEQLLQLAHFPAIVTSEVKDVASDINCWLTISESDLNPDQIELLIGNNGGVLDSIQYLANTILNLAKEEVDQGAYIVDVAGYRAQRQQALMEMAEAAIAHVRETGEEYEMSSLSSAERRQLHTLLKQQEDLDTYSRGQEPDRRLVVRLLSPDSDA